MTSVIVIGSGLGSLSAAALLAKNGFKVQILEQNWIPGGCTSTYPRKNFLFESGATTLVGLDEGMPLGLLQKKLEIKFCAWKLKHPMQVFLPDGTILQRHENLETWIVEVERVFGKNGQRKFWTTCFKISQWVWNAAGRFLTFPPERIQDFWPLVKNTQPRDLMYLKYAFTSVKKFIRFCGITHPMFEKFINEQLMITAQNHADDVNMLFGATALCYTNTRNYYAPGGMISLVETLINYIETHEGKVNYRESVKSITKKHGKYIVETSANRYTTDFVISGIPLNNLAEITDQTTFPKTKKIFQASELCSAFQIGLVVKDIEKPECLHYQIHTDRFKESLGSSSLFISFSHPDDKKRTLDNTYVLSVSTHIQSANRDIYVSKEQLLDEIIQLLEEKKLLNAEKVIYAHASMQKSWKKWTGRQFGFVGGYPQKLGIYPWAMNSTRIDKQGLYGCGDTFYPGQGIPGVVLSGMIAAEKLILDHGKPLQTN